MATYENRRFRVVCRKEILLVAKKLSRSPRRKAITTAKSNTKTPRSRTTSVPPDEDLPDASAYPIIGKLLLGPEELLRGAAEVAELARRESIHVVLVGGVAMQTYGSDRLTADVDVAAEEIVMALPELHRLTFGGIATETPGGVPVDLIVRDDDYAELYRDAMTTALAMPGLPARVVRPEELAAMKMAAARDKDMLDLKFLIGSGVANLPRTRLLIHRHLGPYAAREFDRLVDEVAWIKQREKGR